jgi:hypothetical protein
MAHQIFVFRQGIRTRLGLQLNGSTEDYVTFGEIDDASIASFDVAIPPIRNSSHAESGVG